MVTKPQNVLVMRDVACAGYVAGGNCRFFAENDDGQFTVDACNANLMSRLSFADDVTDKYASMMAFPAHEGQFKGGQHGYQSPPECGLIFRDPATNRFRRRPGVGNPCHCCG